MRLIIAAAVFLLTVWKIYLRFEPEIAYVRKYVREFRKVRRERREREAAEALNRKKPAAPTPAREGEKA